jgi:pimeloyl-ACP methyl ester carboxylesterase
MRHKKISLTTVDGINIAGTHTISDGRAVVLWLHGITVNKDEYLDFFKEGASFLGQYGIDSLRIDFRGHGDSGGTSLDFTISGQMLDVEAAKAYLNTHYRNRPIALSLVGCSFGAPPAIFAAAQYSAEVHSIVLIAPVLSYLETFIEPSTDWARSLFNANTVGKLRQSNKLWFNDSFAISAVLYEEMSLIDPTAFISKIQAPITLIHGTDDSMVPYQVSSRVAMHYNKLKLVSMEGMDHGFTDSNDEIGTNPKSIANKNRIFKTILKAAIDE